MQMYVYLIHFKTKLHHAHMASGSASGSTFGLHVTAREWGSLNQGDHQTWYPVDS